MKKGNFFGIRGRAFAAVLIWCFCLGQLAPASLVGQENPPGTNAMKMFDDVPRTHWAYDAIEELTSHGIMIGYFDKPQNTFRGERTLSRYEFAYALQKAVLKIEDDIRKEQKNVDIEEFLRSKNVSPKDIELLSLLMQEFKKDLADMNLRVTRLEEARKQPVPSKTPLILSITALVVSLAALILAASK